MPEPRSRLQQAFVGIAVPSASEAALVFLAALNRLRLYGLEPRFLPRNGGS